MTRFKVGDKVETTSPTRNFTQVLPAYSIGRVIGFGGTHATSNGGGTDIMVRFAGREFLRFKNDETGHFAKNEDGSYATELRGDWLMIRDKNLTLIEAGPAR